MKYAPLQWDRPEALIRLVRWLDSQAIIDLSAQPLPDDPSNDDLANTLSQMTIVDTEGLSEFGLAAFLYWFHTHKYVKRFPNTGTFHFLELSPTHTLFLLRLTSTGALDLYDNVLFMPSVDLLPRREAGRGQCDICPRMLALRFNCTSLLLGRRGANPEEFFPPPRKTKDCKGCQGDMTGWIVEKILNDDRYASLLGGYGMVLAARPALLRAVYGAEEPPRPEPIFNAFLALHLFGQGDFDCVASGVAIHKPIVCNEMDVILCNFRSGKQLVIETSMEVHLNPDHIRNKLLNAGMLARTGASDYSYVYSSLAKESGGSAQAKMYAEVGRTLGSAIGFRRLFLPEKYARLHNRNEPLEAQQFREVFQYYLRKLQKYV